MKTILKISAFVLLLVMSTLTFAQTREGHGIGNGKDVNGRAIKTKRGGVKARMNKLTEWMNTNLDLSADQKTKVGTINSEYAKTVAGVKKEYKGKQDKTGAKEKIKAAKKKQNSELKSALDDKQYKKYVAYKKKTRQEIKKRKQIRREKGKGKKKDAESITNELDDLEMELDDDL